MNRKQTWLALGLYIIAVSQLFAGPFGIEMGMSLEKLESMTGVAPKKDGDIYFITPPKTHPQFDLYVVRASTKHGIYYIKAIGCDISTSSYGIELKQKFYNLEESIGKIYGKHSTYDYLLSGSIWTEPDDFMMGLIKKDRSLFAIWDTDSGSTLTPDLESIAISAYPLSTNKGYLAVEYSFANLEEAEKELQEEMDSVF